MKKRALSLLLALALCVSLATVATAVYDEPLSMLLLNDTPLADLTPSGIADVEVALGQEAPLVYTVYAPAHLTVNMNTYGMVLEVSLIDNVSYRFEYGEEYQYVHPVGGYERFDPGYFTPIIAEGSEFVLDEGAYIVAIDETDFLLIVLPLENNNASPSTWAVDYVNTAIDAGLVPDALQSKYTTATTRAEFCALAVALYENVKGSEITERSTFSDTTDVNVEKMAALNVVNGVGDGKFSPNSPLTREQAATMLSRLADAIGKPLTAQAPTFKDKAAVSSWAVDAVGQMQATGIMTGVGDNTFAPKSDYTREQSIITILRLFDAVK